MRRVTFGFTVVLFALSLPLPAAADVVFTPLSSLDGLSNGQETKSGLTITYNVGGDSISISQPTTYNVLGIDSGGGDANTSEINGSESISVSFDQDVLVNDVSFDNLGGPDGFELAEVMFGSFGTFQTPGSITAGTIPLSAGENIIISAVGSADFQVEFFGVMPVDGGGTTHTPEPSSLLLASMILGVIGIRTARQRWRQATTSASEADARQDSA